MIGTIESGGVIRDKSNRQVGNIESGGTIRNGSNSQIGKLVLSMIKTMHKSDRQKESSRNGRQQHFSSLMIYN